MAINTAEKRRSVVGPSFQYFSPGVTPNASKDSAWRQQSGHSYSGFAAGGGAAQGEGTVVPIVIYPESETVTIRRLAAA